jgi:ATP-dependent RNA helicase DeaD
MTKEATSFEQLELSKEVLSASLELGYETPTPIQAETIPFMLAGRDVLGQAQTGTGKTAAFAMPILSTLDIKQKNPQVLVLAPTRELAIQVSEAFQTYARNIKGFNVLPIYGGQDFRGQLRSLSRGVHVVVGTPGRVMDHMRRKTLVLDELKTLVLDEADEMLRMGFIDDVEWILEQTPKTRQIALFSATLPVAIRKIAAKYLNNPESITVKFKTSTAETIRQRFWPVSGMHKLDALTRILEAEPFDRMIVFVRTRIAASELADKLSARGYRATALSGDVEQKRRERIIDQLKKSEIEILVATDVAARGLDVEGISHVINYDIPHDTEAYVHRIGRTGRAGRTGDAILFVAPRERRMLSAIERATGKTIERMQLPSYEMVNTQRIDRFKQKITDTLSNQDNSLYAQIVDQYSQEHNVPNRDIAAALGRLSQGDKPLLLEESKQSPSRSGDDDRSYEPRKDRKRQDKSSGTAPIKRRDKQEEGTENYRIEVGSKHEVTPRNIVGAIANEADIDARYIGRIEIMEDYSTIDLPEGMPSDTFKKLKKVWVQGQQLNITRAKKTSAGKKSQPYKGKPKPTGKPRSKPRDRS